MFITVYDVDCKQIKKERTCVKRSHSARLREQRVALQYRPKTNDIQYTNGTVYRSMAKNWTDMPYRNVVRVATSSLKNWHNISFSPFSHLSHLASLSPPSSSPPQFFSASSFPSSPLSQFHFNSYP